VAHDVDVDPELLRPLARRTAAVLDVLVPLPALDPGSRSALAGTAAGAAVLAELDALTGSLNRAAREIGELAAGLAAAAASVEHADAAAGRALRGLREPG
jgi:hypothetical protein